MWRRPRVSLTVVRCPPYLGCATRPHDHPTERASLPTGIGQHVVTVVKELVKNK